MMSKLSNGAEIKRVMETISTVDGKQEQEEEQDDVQEQNICYRLLAIKHIHWGHLLASTLEILTVKVHFWPGTRQN